MAGSGPAPNPNSRRQTSGATAGTWTDLPAGGYTGPVPPWPFSKKSPSESGMWLRYWKKPQAAAWAHLGLVDEVAMYVRTFQRGVAGSEAAVSEARQWANQLGLTPSSLLKNRWRIREVEVGVTVAASAGTSSKRTLKAVDG